MAPSAEDVAGLKLMERRLLTLYEGTPADDTAARDNLQATLTRIRGAREEIEHELCEQWNGR